MLKCARCKLARYCGKECQAADWRAAHKRACPLLCGVQDLLGMGRVRFDPMEFDDTWRPFGWAIGL